MWLRGLTRRRLLGTHPKAPLKRVLRGWDHPRVSGVLTIGRKLLSQKMQPHAPLGVSVKAADPVTSGPDTYREEAAVSMLANGFRHLPVTEGASVLGIVSLRDVLSTRIRRRPR